MADEKDMNQQEEVLEDQAPDVTTAEELAEEMESSEEMVQDLAALQEEFDNRYKRLQADFDNFRRRTNQEKEQLSGFIKGDVLKDLLPVLDNFERALAVETEGDTKTFLDGFTMIYNNLKQAAEKHGLKAIDALGQPFDPNLHQAIQRVDNDEYDADVICQVFQTGYEVDGRVIRPAMVVVSNGK
ncbi:MAG: nucleotide exchange factor GrpE [Veillonella sp.]|nr:nucleotide exchange factor GrpE [Veillonella sp.]MCF0156276.1 nucleotide exchange factor GrpE [Veillonella sp.]